MTTSLLDFEALTAPISAEQPAGTRLPAETRKKMEDGRKEFEPHPDDPSKPPIPKKADWAGIIRVANDTLTKTSRDLLTAARLVEALTKRNGFAGLRDGLTLLRLMVDNCWERMHPVIEGPEDVDMRAGPFQWLTDTESGAWFPQTVRTVPLLKIGNQTANLQDFRTGTLDGAPLSKDAINHANPATPTVVEDVAECLTQLDAIDQSLTTRMEGLAPSLGPLREVLEECRSLLNLLKSPEPAGTDEEAAGGTDGAGAAGGGKAVGNRAEAYRRLAQLADELSRMEPHSPIPDLLRWAVKLGSMSFRDLIRELVREPTVLADIRRQFGIKEEAPPAAE
jgi:type VI secretion system protein ImpA